MDLRPTKGDEIRKTRPAVVIGSDSIRRLKLPLVVAITEWSDSFGGSFWHVKIQPTELNGLEKVSAVDALQLRAVALERFGRKIGRVTPAEVEEIATAIAAVIEYD